MPLEFYKIIHIVGLVMLFSAMGGAVLNAVIGRPKAEQAFRKMIMITHGIGLLLLLIAGFGMMARLSITGFPWPLWLYGKLGIWIIFGGLTPLLLRKPKLGPAVWWIAIALGGTAAYLAIMKPG